MKKLIILFLFGLFFINMIYAVNITLEWNQSINYANGFDQGNSVVVDGSGNSYVTGYISNGLDNDIYITSYDNSGVHRWNQSIKGLGNGNDGGQSIVVDGSGNSYVTGSIYNGINYDIYIVSYNSSGVHRWNQSINGAGNVDDFGDSIVVDGSGNSYIMAYANNGVNDDIYITSYDNSGVHRWNQSINGLGNGDDYGTSIVVDGSGNSYITGYIYNGVNNDMYITSYNSSGSNRWNQSNSIGGGESIVVDGSGNSYVTGYVPNLLTTDIYIISYGNSGVHRWNISINGAGDDFDVGKGIVVDGSGNSYIMAYVSNGLIADIYIVSYDSSGVHRWNKSINDPGNGWDESTSIVVDSSGNSYVTGYVFNGVNTDLYITSYDNGGNHRWNKSINGPGNSADYGNSIVVDSSGNSYVTGSVYNGVNNDIFIIKISEDGTIISSTSSPSSIFPIYGINSILISFGIIFSYFIFS